MLPYFLDFSVIWLSYRRSVGRRHGTTAYHLVATSKGLWSSAIHTGSTLKSPVGVWYSSRATPISYAAPCSQPSRIRAFCFLLLSIYVYCPVLPSICLSYIKRQQQSCLVLNLSYVIYIIFSISLLAFLQKKIKINQNKSKRDF